MKLIYPSAKGFAKAMDAVCNLVDEGTFNITKEGVSLMAMDPSQISMIIFKLPKDSFLEYELDEEKKVSLDITNFKKVLGRARAKNETITITDSGNKLNISFESEKTKRGFKIPMLEISEGINKEPKIEYRNIAKIKTEPLKEIVKDAAIVANYIKIKVTQDAFEIDAKSEGGEVAESFEAGSDEVVEIKAETGAKAVYPIQYLDDLLKASGKEDVATIYIENDMPLKLEYKLEGAFVRYYLAPRREIE